MRFNNINKFNIKISFSFLLFLLLFLLRLSRYNKIYNKIYVKIYVKIDKIYYNICDKCYYLLGLMCACIIAPLAYRLNKAFKPDLITYP